MIIVDELQYLLTVMFHPSDYGEKKPNIITSMQFYYVSTFISLIILVGLTFFLPNQITQTTNILYEILGWLALPFIVLVEALVIHAMGKNFLSAFKHKFAGTFHAAILPTAFIMAFIWLAVIYPPISIAILAILVAWALVLLVVALSNMQDASRVETFVISVVAYGTMYLALSIVLLLLLAVNAAYAV